MSLLATAAADRIISFATFWMLTTRGQLRPAQPCPREPLGRDPGRVVFCRSGGAGSPAEHMRRPGDPHGEDLSAAPADVAVTRFPRGPDGRVVVIDSGVQGRGGAPGAGLGPPLLPARPTYRPG